MPHDRLFLDALERDLKREKAGGEPTSVIQGEPARSFRYDPRKSLYEQFGSETGKVASTINSASRPIDPGLHYDVPMIHDECSDARSHQFALSFKGRNRISRACNKSVSQASRHLVGTADEPSECGVRSRERESSYLSPTYLNTTPDLILPIESCLNSSAYLRATAASVHIPNLGSPGDLVKCPSYVLSSPTRERAQNNIRVFSCPYDFCKRPFKRFEHLRRHVRCHTDDRPFTCDICHRTFTRRDNLAQHARTHNKSRNQTEMQHQSHFQPNRSISIPVRHDLFTSGRGLDGHTEGSGVIETKSPALPRAITAPPVWVGTIPSLPTEDSRIPPILTTDLSNAFIPTRTTHNLPLLGPHVPNLRLIAEDHSSSSTLDPCKSPVRLHPSLLLHDDKETLQKHAADIYWAINDTDVL